MDAYRRNAEEYNIIHYGLFVAFFPHLIAGPILHHKEMMPQFSQPKSYRFSYGNLAVGLTIFFIGLFKKVIFADTVAAGYVEPVFGGAVRGGHLDFLNVGVELWPTPCSCILIFLDIPTWRLASHGSLGSNFQLTFILRTRPLALSNSGNDGT